MTNLLLPLALLGCVSSPAAESAGQWRPLFDGRTLSGWTPKITGHALGEDPYRTFRAEDGMIRVSYDGYDGFKGRFGHLAYETPESAFRIRFQYRFYGSALADVESWQHSNSGLMFHGQPPETMTRGQAFPVSLEVQLIGPDGPAPHTTGNLCTPGTNVTMEGKLVTDHCIAAAGPMVPDGNWTDVEVEVRPDGTIRHLINGEEVIRYAAPQLDPEDADAKRLIDAGAGLAITGGYLSLQSEGHPVEFRNIELMELAN